MAGPFDFLHIKGRTAGSSNELSFDVLDAARSGLDNQKSRSSRPLVGPKPSQGTYHGVAGSSTLSAVPEVARRKRERRAHLVRRGVIAAVLLVLVLGAAGFTGYRFYQDSMTFAGRFNALIQQLVEVDKTLVQVDALMNDPLNAIELDERSEVADSFPAILASLARVEDEAKQLVPDALGPGDVANLEAVQEAASAREDLIAAAADAFILSDLVNSQVDAANSAWNLVIEADSRAREAASIANEATTEEATQQGNDLTQEAIDGLASARAQLVAVEQEIGEEIFAAEKDYIDKRVESLQAAVQTADALLDGDREAARTFNEAYNDADRQAAAMAKELAASPGEVVKGHYSSEMQTNLDRYSRARSVVSTADAELRNS